MGLARVRFVGSYCNSELDGERLRDLRQRAGSGRTECPPVAKRASVVKLPSATKVEIARRYQAGERPVDLAREYGVSEWRVQELRKRFSLAKHPIGMTDSEIEMAALLYSQGLSFNKIGARVGRDPNTIAKELRLRGIAR